MLALLTGLALPTFLLLSDIEAVAYHLQAYRESFVATGAPARLGLTTDQLLWTIRRTLDYATSRRPDLQFDRAALDNGAPGRLAFTDIELQHMVDVRALFALARKVRWAALALAAAGMAGVLALERRRWQEQLARGAIIGSAVFLALLGVLGVAAATGFGAFWTRFHETLFSNNLWLLPIGTLLIEMLPESLFQRLVLEVLGLFAVEVLAVVLLAIAYLRRAARAARS